MRGAWLVVVTGCGRIAFDPRVDATTLDDASDDTSTSDTFLASTCPQPSTVICESFDVPLAAQWMPISGGPGGNADHSTARTYRGLGGLEATTVAANAGTSPKATVRTTQGLPIAGTLYARVWVYLPTPWPSVYQQFLTFSTAGGLGVGIGVNSMNRLSSNDFADGTFLASATLAPFDRWFCMILQVPSGDTGEMRVYLDDVELGDLAQANPTPQAAAEQLYLGLEWPSNSIAVPQVTAWFDELIVDTEPITCAQ